MTEKKYNNLNGRHGGFTVAELILALSVTAVILAAAATLAFGMSSAEDATNEMSEKQAHLRFTSIRLSELIRNSCMAFSYSTNGVILWVEDKSADGIINGDEIAWICTDDAKSTVRLIEFPDQSAGTTRDALQNGSDLKNLYNLSGTRETVLLSDCSGVSITVDSDEKFVILDFKIEENDVWKSYQVCAGLRADSEYLFDKSGNFVTGDDDI